MFLHISARVWGRRWSPHTPEQKSLYVKTTIIHQLCVPDCAYMENMFINSIHINLYDISLTQNILYQGIIVIYSPTFFNWPNSRIPECTCSISHNAPFRTEICDQIHESQNAPIPYPTMLHWEQKCAHFCSEWSNVGNGTGAFWKLWNWYMQWLLSILSFTYNLACTY